VAGRRFSPIQQIATSAAIAAVGSWLAFNHGTYSLTSRSAVAIAVWWAIVLASVLGIARLRRPTREALFVGGCLLGFGILTLASVAWAPNAGRTIEEFDRISLYLGVFIVIVALLPAIPPSWWSDGLAGAVAAIALLSLTTRLVPELANTGAPLRLLLGGQSRLAYPIGDWNALAVLFAVGVPLLSRAALEARTALARGAAAAVLPAIAGALYLTSSRAGALATAVAIVIFVLACSRRVAATALLVLSGGAGVAVISVLKGKPALVNGPLGSASAATQGHSAAVPVALACLAVGALWAAGSRWMSARRYAALEKLVAAALVVAVVGGVALVHPIRLFQQFKQTNIVAVNSPKYTTQHLLSASGNGRWQLWTVAAREWRAHPLLGGGAGSFQPWWMQHRPYALYVINAHSLFIETLAELGVVGLVLLVGFAGGGLFVGARRVLRAPPERRTLAAGLTAALAAYYVGAAVDWTWQVTAVTVVAIVITAVLAGTHASVTRPGQRELPLAIGAVFAIVGAALIVAQALPMISAMQLHSSQVEAANGDLVTAAKRAASAREAAPWSSDPYLQLSLIQERAGSLVAARKSVTSATDRAPRDWQLWEIRARIELEAGSVAAARRSLQTAEHLNPLWAATIGAG
jgi:hypothetical protein